MHNTCLLCIYYCAYENILALDCLKDQGHSHPMSFPALPCEAPTVAARAMLRTQGPTTCVYDGVSILCIIRLHLNFEGEDNFLTHFAVPGSSQRSAQSPCSSVC